VTEPSQFFVAHGLTILFVVILVEQIGAPIPALPWLLGAGALAASGKISAFLAMGVTILACMLANTFWFYLGRFRGRQVLGWACRISLELDSSVRRTQRLLTRHGSAAILLSKFLPGLGTVAPPLAGMSEIHFGRFLWIDFIGSLAFATAGIAFGYCFSDQIDQIIASLSQIGKNALLLLLAMAASYVAYKFWQRQRLFHELRMARITAAELRQKLANGEKPVILDLRSRAELTLNPQVIPGAIHVEFEELAARSSEEIPHDRDVVVYCSCPNEVTSARFARLLHKKGLTHIRPLLGGIVTWSDHSYPLEAWDSKATVTGI
jgi:membrane protein DedA with SNARE-associated domain/rhodanese-related sulfurtransferase